MESEVIKRRSCNVPGLYNIQYNTETSIIWQKNNNIQYRNFYILLKDDRTRDCMSREENGCSANICHTIFVEVE